MLFPALRVGYLVMPPALRDAFVAAREALDIFSPTLYQMALATFLNEGHLVRHVRRMRGIYLDRRQALLDGLARDCASSLTILNADAGLHVATLLHGGLRDEAIVARMAERGLAATALTPCFASAGRRQGLLLGFGGSNEATIRSATKVLGAVLGEGR